jgi:glycosyltransferase involved in cell wall biosynthesis
MEIHPTIGILSYKYGIKTVATLNSYLPFLPEQDTASTASIERQLYEISHLPALNRRILRNIDAFISLSKCVKSIYSYYGFDPKQIYQINNIIDPDFSPNKTSEHRNGNRVSLLFVGTLSKKKGPDILLRAMTLLNEYFHLRIVGDGKLKKKLKKFVQSNNLGKRVEFTGAVKYENIPQEYANSDIFVHPSPWPDPFDRTILEAMQSGLPVVTTNLGGSAEAIEDQTLLCQPGSAESLAKSIRIAEDSSSVGARNREYVESHHSPDVVVPRITSLYESLKGT